MLIVFSGVEKGGLKCARQALVVQRGLQCGATGAACCSATLSACLRAWLSSYGSVHSARAGSCTLDLKSMPPSSLLCC
jgi:hypothetical protein